MLRCYLASSLDPFGVLQGCRWPIVPVAQVRGILVKMPSGAMRARPGWTSNQTRPCTPLIVRVYAGRLTPPPSPALDQEGGSPRPPQLEALVMACDGLRKKAVTAVLEVSAREPFCDALGQNFVTALTLGYGQQAQMYRTKYPPPPHTHIHGRLSSPL